MPEIVITYVEGKRCKFTYTSNRDCRVKLSVYEKEPDNILSFSKEVENILLNLPCPEHTMRAYFYQRSGDLLLNLKGGPAFLKEGNAPPQQISKSVYWSKFYEA